MPIPVYTPTTTEMQIPTPTGGTMILKQNEYVKGTYYTQYAAKGLLRAVSPAPADNLIKYTYPEQYEINESATPPIKANEAGTVGEIRIDSSGANLAVYVFNGVIWKKYSYDASMPSVNVTLAYVAGLHGSIVGTAAQTIAYGANGTLVTATPAAGFAFSSWSDAYPTAARTDLVVTSNKSVTAYFDIATFTLSYAGSEGGSIVGLTGQTVNYNTDGALVTATPDVGYEFTAWSDAYPTAARTDINVTANKTVIATFTALTYTLTYTAGANGSIVGTTPQTVNHGANGTLVTATPEAGFHFTTWSDGILTAARTDTNIIEDATVTATFAAD